MMKFLLKQSFIGILYLLGFNLTLQSQDIIKGQIKCQGEKLANVVVSNGYDFTLTDIDGNYSLPLNANAKFVYISTPSGYLPQTKGSIPCFFQNIESAGNAYDFDLMKNSRNDNKHTFIVQADVQVSKEKDIEGYVQYLKDLRQYIDQKKKNSDVFVLDCGDIVGNTPSLYPSYIQASDALGLPFYRSVGNHDMEYGVRSHEHSYKTFENFFGPIYYSFNRGKAHYIVLNNCFYINRHYRYIGYIDERTLQWIEKDLSYVPKDHLVFVAMHIPSSSTKDIKFNALLPDETSNASSLYDLLEGYDAHIFSGHTHYNGNVVFNNRLMEHNTAAVCGTFWKADICTDGTPSGCGVYEVEGNKVIWKYKSMGYLDTYQFKGYPIASSEDYPEDIIANVWNWDELWKVEWYENGKYMGTMNHFEGYDPEAKIICSDRERVEYDWITPIKTDHLFRATPIDKNAMIEIKVTDRFGNIYKQKVSTDKH